MGKNVKSTEPSRRRMPAGEVENREAFWRPLIQQVLEKEEAPFYLFASEPAWAAVGRMEAALASFPFPVLHWLSFKTQPLPPWVAEWGARKRSVEVVSAFELQAVLRLGFGVDQILINGPAKQSWLPQLAQAGQRVHFDSVHEIRDLLPLAKSQGWRVGLRLLTSPEVDIENSRGPTQFGMSPDEAHEAVRLLQKARIEVEGIHFHLRSNAPSPSIYQQALREAADLCRELGIKPRYVDTGGGLPPSHTLTKGRQPFDKEFSLDAWARLLKEGLREFPDVRELWLENGRFISASSGVLVMRILDSKLRQGVRHLICNAGRTLNALVSNWEVHDLWSMPARRGNLQRTIVSGPTCMAFDQIASGDFPASLRPGDHLVWMDAGAYHLPWEIRFSHGLIPVWWSSKEELSLVRKRESFEAWWSQWI